MRNSMGSGSGAMMHPVDAEEFSKKIITLKVGSATKEGCVQLLGKPAINTSNNGVDSISYYLANTGNVIPSMAVLTFKDNVLSKVNVHKTSFNNGILDSSNIYSQGSR